MKSLGTRLAVVISSILFFLMLIVGLWLDHRIAQTIQDDSVEFAEVHAKTILGSLKTIMLNGNGTLTRDWLDRLYGVNGIEDINVLRTDGTPAFTDLDTVSAVNEFLGQPRFTRQAVKIREDFKPVDSGLMQNVLSGKTTINLGRPDQINVLLPIQADVECLTCHGYDFGRLRGVLTLSIDNSNTLRRINSTRLGLWTFALLLVIVLGLALWTALRLNVLAPIATLRNALTLAGLGERTALMPIGRQDEIGDLANVFNAMQAALRDSEERTHAVMDNVVDGIITIRANGKIELANPAVHRIFGYQNDELVGKFISSLTPDNFSNDEHTILGGKNHQVVGIARELTGKRKNGSVFPMDVAISEMQQGNEIYFVAIIRDITTRNAHTAALRYQALHDALTDLPNRTLLLDRLQFGLRTAQRERQSLALIMMDLDRFKEVNDTLGHQAGDKLLQHISQRLLALLRDSDTVARLGGDEFAVLLPNADAAKTISTARRIIQDVQKPIIVQGQTLSVGASLGIALYPAHGDNAVVLMQRADVAMYVAKRGSHGFSVYDPHQDQHSLRQLAIGNELTNAINADQLLLHYQPKICLGDQRVVGVEALVRWQHPRHGLLAPDEFVPLAEETGQIKPLTQWVLECALRECKLCLQTGLNIQLSINLSVRNLTDSRFADDLVMHLNRMGMSRERIKLEITETALMVEPEISINALHRLNDLGFALAIDDFGIGYSSLAYLKRLPVHELKIDKSFGQSLAMESNSMVIVRSTIDMAHQLGLTVVAEGVETKQALDLLKQSGCDAVQGRYIAAPMPMQDMMQWMQDNATMLQQPV
ncbi:MAG: EAL domain-containing protein [Gammaproteobacteria bacterium]|nr:EAL domain-containing protein [Gammaproteobacteria bacterium]MDH5730463.1 EAL domain-containing protein [Gammaproteobacteria bacterium]